jgi:hypothetical protein
LVTIAPSLIGVPLAAWPGLGPHDEVLTEPLLALVVALEELELAPAPALELLLLLLLLLLPQPASAAAPMSTASAMIVRRRSAWWYILTSVLLLGMIRLTRPGLARRRS